MYTEVFIALAGIGICLLFCFFVMLCILITAPWIELLLKFSQKRAKLYWKNKAGE